MRLDVFLDVARDKPDQSAQSHEWNRSRLYAVIEISEADAEPLSRLLLTQQVIAVAGITLYLRHAERAIVKRGPLRLAAPAKGKDSLPFRA